jgi:hypothetical protein
MRSTFHSLRYSLGTSPLLTLRLLFNGPFILSEGDSWQTDNPTFMFTSLHLYCSITVSFTLLYMIHEMCQITDRSVTRRITFNKIPLYDAVDEISDEQIDGLI